MDKLYVEGGHVLRGEVEISGAKNAVLPILCATILAPRPVLLDNVPHLRDIDTTIALLNCLNVHAQWVGEHRLRVDATQLDDHAQAPYELVKTMRASILVLGPLLGRCGYAKVSLPGGCSIGARPVDLHLKTMQSLGAQIKVQDGYIIARAAQAGGTARCLPALVGSEIYFDIVTVTGTENAIMAAVMAQGESVIHNAACEPEVVDLINFLNSLGAQISGAGSSTLRIVGGFDANVARQTTEFQYRIMPDRIEAGSYLAAVAITGGQATLVGVRPADMDSIIVKLCEMGVHIESCPDKRTIFIDSSKRPLQAISPVITAPYPGFPTDMQAQLMALATLANGDSCIIENIFENRFMHVAELVRMGAKIDINGNQACVHGVQQLFGTTVMATDLRASASLVIAGLAAQGVTKIDRVYHLDRGYERICEKLNGLGAKVWRDNK